MATTTNFGWTTPDDTDLVKDGAAAIRTLGSAIDTSLVDLKGGTTGQVLSKASNTDMDFTWASDATGIPATIFDAKGDLIGASAADTAARLAVGANGTVLTADSAETTGLKWAVPSAGALALITRQTISSSSGTNIDSIFSSTYTNYLIVIDNTNGSAGSNDLQLQFRYSGTTNTSNYKYFNFQFGNTVSSSEISAGSSLEITPSLGDGTDNSLIEILISQVGNSSQKPVFQVRLANQYAGTPRLYHGKLNSAQNYDGIRLITNTGTFGCNISIYGLAKS